MNVLKKTAVVKKTGSLFFIGLICCFFFPDQTWKNYFFLLTRTTKLDPLVTHRNSCSMIIMWLANTEAHSLMNCLLILFHCGWKCNVSSAALLSSEGQHTVLLGWAGLKVWFVFLCSCCGSCWPSSSRQTRKYPMITLGLYVHALNKHMLRS